MPEDPAVQPKDKKDILNTPAAEAAEMESLLNQGLQAHNHVGFYTFLGIVMLALAGIYFKYDRNLFSEKIPFEKTLQIMVDNQVDKDIRTYKLRSDAPGVEQNFWPARMYGRLRGDIFVVCIATLLLAGVFIGIERAKSKRNNVLVYRALAREIEKLRLRVKQLEGKGGGSSDNKNEPDSADSESEKKPEDNPGNPEN